MSRWQLRPVPFKYQLSDLTLFNVSLPLQARQISLLEEVQAQAVPVAPVQELLPGSQGFMIRGLPVTGELPRLGRSGDYLCYVPLQYQHCYIDMSLSFEQYQQKFGSKTRSTINRKIRKFTEHCGGSLVWKTYSESGEMRDFLALARQVSKLTYQEKLLDAGIPDSEAFARHAEELAAAQQVRGYILFHGERPVSYLYCPVQDGVLIYAYLGYDPAYMQLSVGTVLQWVAVEKMFEEGKFRCFDFTEGQSEHKRLFATHQRQCANVFLIKNTLRNRCVIVSHMLMDDFSKWLGHTMDRFGLKKRIKRLLRFAT